MSHFNYSGGPDPKIAVLHPRRLSVYSLQVQRGKNRESDSFSLGLQYQFSLSRSAHSIVVGPFGGGGGGGAKKDYLCVQSLDGTLNLFEQDTFAFSRFLPDFLLPGPIVYAPRTDSFVVASSSHRIESYRYQALAAAGDAAAAGGQQRPKSDDVVSGKRVAADWILGLGEEVARLQVVAAAERDRPDTLVAVGARTVCAMYDTGVVVFMKKLDFAPLCSLSYRPEGGLLEDQCQYIIRSFG